APRCFSVSCCLGEVVAPPDLPVTVRLMLASVPDVKARRPAPLGRSRSFALPGLVNVFLALPSASVRAAPDTDLVSLAATVVFPLPTTTPIGKPELKRLPTLNRFGSVSPPIAFTL